MMKTIPNISLEEIQTITTEQAMAFKNKFLCYQNTDDGRLILTFFINPYQSYTKHRAAATKKIKELFKKGLIKNLTPCINADIYFIGTNHKLNNLIQYEYKIV